MSVSDNLSINHFNSFCNSVSNDNIVSLWHKRLGHLPMYQLKNLDFMNKHNCYFEFPCDICPKARQHKLPFPSSSIHSTNTFDLIHIDTWGPYNTKTYDGFSYFLTIVDDYSRTTWSHLLSTKSNAFSVLKGFIAMVQTQFGKSIKMIRSDNAYELGSSKEASQFFQEKGIIHQTSCRSSPQQNGVVERKHKHMLVTARALLFQSNLPIKFWGDCVLTATYLINRFPTKVLNGDTPFFKLYRKQPQYSHLKSFGCLCFRSTLKEKRSKFSPRASPTVFIGYPYGKKAYKLYDLESHKVIISRDVHFHENIYPFSIYATYFHSHVPKF